MPSPPLSDHDLREVPPGTLADFDPTANEPDPDVWPLASDNGAATFSGDPSDLVPIYNTIPEPHVRWVTPEQFEYEFGYHPDRPEELLSDEELSEVADHDRLTLTEDRLEAFRRIAEVWNGEAVGRDDVHLLADRVPSWSDLLGGLDAGELEALQPTVRQHDEQLVEAFGGFGWFEPEHTSGGWVKSTFIARKRADYDLEERARVLINGREDLPSLRGDPHEGLTHRYGVGLEAARAKFYDRLEVETYASLDNYTVDLLEYDNSGERIAEVLTHHHNNELYRATYAKINNLQRPAILLFDKRATAYRVLNHWEKNGADVPGAPFESNPRLDWTRQQFQNAVRDSERNWLIEDLLTVTKVEDIVLKSGGGASREQLMSLNW